MEMIVMTLILGAIFGAFFLISRVTKSGNSEVVHSNAASKALKLFTKDDVSRHNSRTDCWIIIKDKVYDVTPYVEEHPGGDAILAHAGDDSTEGFYGPQHATRVFDMVDEFYIGDLKR